MKRKITVAVLVAIMLLNFAGCAEEPSEPPVSIITETPVSAVPDTKEPTVEETIEPVKAGDSGMVYSNEYDMAILFNNGERERLYDLSWIDGNVCGISGDYVVSLLGDYSSDSGDYYYSVIVYNIPFGYNFTIYSGEDVESADVYEDIVYITCMDDETGVYTERAYDIASGAERQAQGQEYYDAITGFSLAGEGFKTFSYLNSPCYLRLRDTSSYVILRKNYSDYYTFDGELIESLNLGENISEIYSYDEYALVYSVYSEDYYPIKLMVRNADGEEVEISSESPTFLQYKDGVVYYALIDDTVYATPTTLIHAYDVITETDRLLTTPTRHPGMPDNIRPGISGFTCLSDNIYYIADNGEDVSWYSLPKDVTEYREGTPLDILLEKNPYEGIGTVSSLSDTKYCDICNSAYLKFGTDYFIFDESVSPFYEKMNGTLFNKAKKMQEAFVNEFLSGDDFVTGCEYHEKEYNFVYQENHVYNVSYRTDKYIVVDESGYWYGGGAHGQEFVSHTLFDLETGEEVTIKDLFKGSLEELKDIVARYTQSDMYNRGEDSPYFSDDPDEVYNSAFEIISFDYFPCEYGENEIIIEYAPYVMGAYASGIISVSIPYSEFGLDGVLN